MVSRPPNVAPGDLSGSSGRCPYCELPLRFPPLTHGSYDRKCPHCGRDLIVDISGEDCRIYRSSVDRFLDYLERSRLVDPAAVAALRTKHPWHTDRQLSAHLIRAGLLTTWQCEKLSKGRFKGFYMGSYRLQQLLGGSLYEVTHVTKKTSAWLHVSPGCSTGAEELAKFSGRASRVNHPGLVTNLFEEQSGSIRYRMFRSLSGVSLEKAIKTDGAMTESKAGDLMLDLCELVEILHRHDVAGVQLDPHYLYRGTEGELRLLVLPAERFSNDSGIAVQHFYPDDASFGPASDVYGLGCLLACVLTGTPASSTKTSRRLAFPAARFASPLMKLAQSMMSASAGDRPRLFDVVAALRAT